MNTEEPTTGTTEDEDCRDEEQETENELANIMSVDGPTDRAARNSQQASKVEPAPIATEPENNLIQMEADPSETA